MSISGLGQGNRVIAWPVHQTSFRRKPESIIPDYRKVGLLRDTLDSGFRRNDGLFRLAGEIFCAKQSVIRL